MGKAEIWLIRTYWDFEFPRPFLPNFEFVGGLHCQPAKPLPKVPNFVLLLAGCFLSLINSASHILGNLIPKEGALLPMASMQLFSNLFILVQTEGWDDSLLSSKTIAEISRREYTVCFRKNRCYLTLVKCKI